jgi:hypothetical protein
MDDVFIYLRVSRNIAEGIGPVFNAGDAHFPVTSPLWVFLLAICHKLFGFIDLVVLSKMLYVIFLALASWLAFLVFRDRAGFWAALTPLPIFFNYITLSSTGGEIALAYFSIFGILWAYFKKKNLLLTGLFAAAAYLSRGELALLTIPIGIHYLFIASKEKWELKKIAAGLGKMVLGFLVVALIWHAYYAIQFDGLFPNTLKTKIVQGKSGMWNLYYRYGRIHTLSILDGHYYLLFFLVFGLYYYCFPLLSLLLFTVMHYYAYQFLIVPHYHWYYYDFYLIIPLFIFLGIAGFFYFLGPHIKKLKWFAQSEQKKLKPIRIASEVVIALFVLIALLVTTHLDRLGDYRTDQRKDRYMRVVDWMKPRMGKGDVVLAHEIGILGYYLDQAIIRDLNGIASPDVTVENINDLGYFVTAYSPRFIFFPTWLSQKNPLKYIAVKKRLAVYEKGYAELAGGKIKESVFIFRNKRICPPYVRVLERLRKRAGYFPDREYEIVKTRRSFVLSAPAPFHSTIAVPGEAVRVKASFGFLPGISFQNQTGSDGVTFSIFGRGNGSRRLLYQLHLNVSSAVDGGGQETADITFRAGEFELLEFVIEADEGLKFLKRIKSYWGPVRLLHSLKVPSPSA